MAMSRAIPLLLTTILSLTPSQSFTNHFTTNHLLSPSKSQRTNPLRLATGESSNGDEESPELKVTVNNSPFPENSHEELMYCLGVNLARQLGDIRPLVEDSSELANVAKGLLDVVIGRLSEEGQVGLLKTRGVDLNNLITERADSLRKRVEESGRAMLQEMSDTAGTTTLPSGVVIHPIEPGPEGFGSGTRPTASSSVKVHYHGTLSDGTVFDSSLSRGEPVKFALNSVIPGWKEAIQKMHAGETAMIGIPPEMGYGKEGTPDGRIPGGATLFFKVQLIDVLTA
eukprot:CAMPEP_0172495522 /NCGR_PEP_ID=MMETSP1066-20121228/71447_1 /TAXON_ID=671091 /ORGANISM="Coscinodiscus wailesii, Strain CCMP2513" /LENGTH=283 /DNA_ID=CAMNT_0013267257 /DNA_START=59 /DNA_END=906 /DNA_ORIENTATION=-